MRKEDRDRLTVANVTLVLLGRDVGRWAWGEIKLEIGDDVYMDRETNLLRIPLMLTPSGPFDREPEGIIMETTRPGYSVVNRSDKEPIKMVRYLDYEEYDRRFEGGD